MRIYALAEEWCRANKIFFVTKDCQDLLQELDTVQWDERASGVGKRVVKAGMSDHAMDSFRYACTKLRISDNRGFVVDATTEKGSPAYWEALRSKARDQAFGQKKEEPQWVKIGRWKRPGRPKRRR